ncbi:ABC transporter permease [Betaproteobacteria bacterium PRO7]|nr:ABC transporter permease [Burkholderiaceae bacterium]MDL1860901.1 ABC transporter permease [Betaproteobacteria bacterium PRO7]
MPKFVFIWTDLAVWLFAAAAAFYAWRVRGNANLRATWRHVAHDAPAMCSGVVLLAFIAVALLDSIHYRPLLPPAPGAAADAAPAYATRTYSVLDGLLAHAIESRERTYSAPLAYRSFQKETLIVDGKETREFPRLAFGGAHLKDPAREWVPDLVAKSVQGVVGGALVAVALAALLAALRARSRGQTWAASWQEIARGHTDVPWRAILLTLALLSLFIGWIAALWPWYHPFGTDRTGNDVLFQALKSIRTAVVIGTLSTVATLPLAIALGILAGYFKGWVDDAIQYFYTVLSSIPPVLLIAALVLLIQVWIDKNPQWFETGLERAEFRLFLLCLILGVTGWATLCRLLRAETLKIVELDYVQAARAFGVSNLRIMARHVLPNVMHLVLIVVVLDFSALVLYEAVLSYVGVGVDPTSSSFGSMINLARSEMARDPGVWWNLASAFVFMLALVLAANLFADAVREAFDPRARVFRPKRWRPALARARVQIAQPAAGTQPARAG